MPELPDLVYIANTLRPQLEGRTITEATVRQPIVIRMLYQGGFREALIGRTFAGVHRHGPFLRMDLEDRWLIAHLMLAGQLQLSASDRAIGHQCFELCMDDDRRLRYGDSRLMGRIYVTPAADTSGIPGYNDQGIDVTDEAFTLTAFRAMMKGKRNQVRVFIMDQSIISAIGNAYADEILFAAGIHPKTRCHELEDGEVEGLYLSVRQTLDWGIQCVADAAAPVEKKIRGHMRVRGRRGQPCPVCGTTIRRTGVLGYDAFFCPRCQPDRGADFIPWASKPGGPET